MPESSLLTRVRLAGIVEESVVDGPGMRLVVFAQGCERDCKGCHNPQSRDPCGGDMQPIGSIIGLYAQNPLLSGITFSGGEPFLQAVAFSILAQKIRVLGGNVMTFTGYRLDELLSAPMSERPGVLELAASSDFIVDGPYVESLRSLDLLFRGSSNQRFLKQSRRKITIAGANRA